MFLYGPLHMNMPVLANQLCVETGCSLGNLLRAMDDMDGERERESGKSVLSAGLHHDDDDNDDFFFLWFCS